jgi:hypothetical protein
VSSVRSDVGAGVGLSPGGGRFGVRTVSFRGAGKGYELDHGFRLQDTFVAGSFRQLRGRFRNARP